MCIYFFKEQSNEENFIPILQTRKERPRCNSFLFVVSSLQSQNSKPALVLLQSPYSKLCCVISFSGFAEGLTRWIYFLYLIRAREGKILTQLCDANVFINTTTLIQQKKLLLMRYHIWHKNYAFRSQTSSFANSATN